MTAKRYSLIDRLLMQADSALKTVVPDSQRAQRPSPSVSEQEAAGWSAAQKRHIAGLMRVNHCGEVCAQALYQGQALTAKRPDIADKMREAAEEEVDHLVWCEQRLQELGSQPSVLNPLFYGLSFSVGALAGAVSDKVSLGFVAATEQQVCQHLSDHLSQLPEDDHRSRAILEQMLEDESHHGNQALDAGGYDFPAPVKGAMTVLSKVMTKTTYKV